MKLRMLDLVCCPECGAKLDLDVFESDYRGDSALRIPDVRCREYCQMHETNDLAAVSEEDCRKCYGTNISEGVLRCVDCSMCYPIIDGIPRLLPSELLKETLVSYHPDFLARNHDYFKEIASATPDQRKLKTIHMFGYQWTTFVDNFGYFREIFLSFVRPFLSPEDFKDKLVLEVGCGSGRPLSVAAEFGAEVVGVDLSEAVRTAHGLSELNPLIHVVQGDATRLPFNPRFDFAYSVGVLQHVSEPRACVGSIASILRPGQKLVLWVYGKRELWYQPIEWARKLTRRLPNGLLHIMSYGMAILSELFLLVPYRILSRIPIAKRLAECIPGRIYAGFPFRENVIGWFDRLGAPVTYYFSRQDLEEMLTDAGFTEVTTVARPGASASWVVQAEKADVK